LSRLHEQHLNRGMHPVILFDKTLLSDMRNIGKFRLYVNYLFPTIWFISLRFEDTGDGVIVAFLLAFSP
jgi:hypothetical protein